MAGGLAASLVAARSLGDSRLLASNSTPEGREENRRVEIVLSGDPIGATAFWDRPQTLVLRPR